MMMGARVGSTGLVVGISVGMVEVEAVDKMMTGILVGTPKL